MWVFREPEKPDMGKDALTFAVGALGGLAVGMLLSRRAAPQRVSALGSDLRERARSVAQRLRPARLRRAAPEQMELTQLEDAVLDAFLADEVLSERGIDVGAISDGIIELSGSVRTEDEADRAVRVASGLPGVRTVVNRLEVEEEAQRLRRHRGEEAGSERGWTSGGGSPLTGGMGTRRASRGQDPDRPDDSHYRRERALAEADRDQWADEGLAAINARQSDTGGVQEPNRTRYREDELDNQDPHAAPGVGKHGARTRDEEPQRFNTAARVSQDAQGTKPGIEMRLEDSDVPVKPHSDGWTPRAEDEAEGREPDA